MYDEDEETNDTLESISVEVSTTAGLTVNITEFYKNDKPSDKDDAVAKAFARLCLATGVSVDSIDVHYAALLNRSS